MGDPRTRGQHHPHTQADTHRSGPQPGIRLPTATPFTGPPAPTAGLSLLFTLLRHVRIPASCNGAYGGGDMGTHTLNSQMLPSGAGPWDR